MGKQQHHYGKIMECVIKFYFSWSREHCLYFNIIKLGTITLRNSIDSHSCELHTIKKLYKVRKHNTSMARLWSVLSFTLVFLREHFKITSMLFSLKIYHKQQLSIRVINITWCSTNYVNYNQDRRISTGVAFVDFEKAFDSIWHYGYIF